MTAQTDPYVRVYYRIIDDPKFDGVYDNDAALAAWLRLLLAADAMYPAPAHLPRGVRPAALRRLVDVGLVDLMPGDRYRLHGLNGERAKRRDQAQKAARKRWEDPDPDADADAPPLRPHSTSNAAASGDGMHSAPSQAKQVRDEPSQAKPPELQASELPSEDDSATIACRQLFDSGKWLSDREYVAAWEDMDRRYTSEWVQPEIAPAFAACLEKRGKVLPWDLKRMTEQRLAERSRSEEREHARQVAESVKRETERHRAEIEAATPEQREQAELQRQAIHLARKLGVLVPTDPSEVRKFVMKHGSAA